MLEDDYVEQINNGRLWCEIMSAIAHIICLAEQLMIMV